MVLDVVQVVAAERLDGEHRCRCCGGRRGAHCAACDTGVDVGDGLGGRGDQVDGHRGRVLVGVPPATAARSWSQFVEQRVVLGRASAATRGEDPVHVADVAGVLQRRPDVRAAGATATSGGASTGCQALALRVDAVRAPRPAAPTRASNPQSGQGRSRTQVQSLVSEARVGCGGVVAGSRSAVWRRRPGRGRGCGAGRVLREWPWPRDVTIRPAVEDDLSDIAAIYNHEIANSTATFDLEPPTLAYWEQRLAGKHEGDHLLVAVDADEDVVGYAYSWSYRPRPAYNLTRETSIYLDPSVRGQGIGRRALPGAAGHDGRRPGSHTAVALVALPNAGSVALHKACGFEHVGTMREVGLQVRPVGRRGVVPEARCRLDGGARLS